MFCHQCGTKLEDDCRFCPECGARQDVSDMEASGQEVPGGIAPAWDAPGEPESSGPPKKGGPWMILIVVLVVVLVGAGGFFGYRLLAKSGTDKSVKTEENKKAEKDDAEDKVKEEEDTEEKDDVGEEDDAEDQAEPYEEGDPIEVTHEYEVVTQRMTWQEASDYCEERGGHLATVTSQEEYNEVLEKANASGVKVLWLGGRRNAQTDSFEWVTREAFSFSDWAAGEPNNDEGVEDRLGIMYVKGSWHMYDLPNDVSPYYGADKVGFVMEKDIEQ